MYSSFFFFFLVFDFLTVLHGHSVFSSSPQRPVQFWLLSSTFNHLIKLYVSFLYLYLIHTQTLEGVTKCVGKTKWLYILQEKFQLLPLEAVYSVCRLAETLGAPSHMATFVQNMAISLVSLLITWEKSTNQETVQRMMESGCELMMKMEDGMKFLLTKALEITKQGN